MTSKAGKIAITAGIVGLTGFGLYYLFGMNGNKSHYSDKRLINVTRKIKNEMFFVNL